MATVFPSEPMKPTSLGDTVKIYLELTKLRIVLLLVFTTVTVFSLPFETNRRPSAVSSMSFGLMPTGISAITLPASVSITEMDRLDQLLT